MTMMTRSPARHRLARIAPRVEALEDRALLSIGAEGMYPLANPVPGNSLILRLTDPGRLGDALNAVGGYAAEDFASGSTLVVLGQDVDPEGAAARLRALEGVAYAEPNATMENTALPTDSYYANGSLWGMYSGDASVSPSIAPNAFGSGAEKAWAAGYLGSSSVYVGVVDEGIQVNHPDLNANVWVNPYDPVDGRDNDGNGYVDDTNGWDFVNNNRTVYDGGKRGRQDNHGTHVAGTIGAEANGSGVVGVNQNVTLISAKFLGFFGGSTADAIEAIDYLTDLKTRHGLNIVAMNNSWGGGGFSQGLLDAITRAANEGILFVAAAGNNGANNDTSANYPSNYDTTAGAGYDSVIAVAALTSTGDLASYSNYGAATVDLAAPGSGIISTVGGSRYANYSGTSMATPHVTGAIALYASAHPRGEINPNESAKDYAQRLKAAVLSNVTATPSLAGKTVTGGRLDVARLMGV